MNLESLDLSSNQLIVVPEALANLSNLEDLNLDHNSLISLPDKLGALKKLKILSLRHNQIAVSSTVFTKQNPQPIPESVFVETKLIDLNLHGNVKLTNTILNEFDGFAVFLDRRQKIKSKTLTNLDVCGLE